MSEAISKITSHFEALGTRVIEVPEWGLTIYSTPVTVAERNRIYSKGGGDNDFELLVRILIEKARNEKGEKLFTIADKAVLIQKADSSVLIRVATEIMSGPQNAPGFDELKNS